MLDHLESYHSYLIPRKGPSVGSGQLGSRLRIRSWVLAVQHSKVTP